MAEEMFRRASVYSENNTITLGEICQYLGVTLWNLMRL